MLQKLEEALSLYDEDRNNLWWTRIPKERDKVFVNIKFLNPVEKSALRYKKITEHWVFDIKLNLTRNGEFVSVYILINPSQ